MKRFLTFSALVFSAASAQAFDFSCTATAIHDESYLEESFTMHEYPEVYGNSMDVTIGASNWSTSDGDTITVLPTVGFEKAIEVRSVGGQRFSIVIDRGAGGATGTVHAQNEDEAQSSHIADLKCD